MNDDEKIKKMEEVRAEYFRRMQVLRDEQAKLVQEAIARRNSNNNANQA